MQFSIAGFSISVERNASRRTVHLSDLNEINSAYYDYTEALSKDELARRVEGVTVRNLQDPSQRERGRKVLEDKGILVIPDVVDVHSCDQARESVKKTCRDYTSRNESVYEDDYALYQVSKSRMSGYKKIAGYGKAVINVRSGQDEGMIDIFNCDMLHPEKLQEFRDVFEDPLYMEVMGVTSLRARNLNVYLNSGITSTRGFHVDSYDEQLKGFIYLGDVDTLDDGPYTYVAGSHKDSGFRRVNRLISEMINPNTEAPCLDPTAIIPVLASKGSLIISDQGGVHRGWPQVGDAFRMIAVMNYR